MPSTKCVKKGIKHASDFNNHGQKGMFERSCRGLMSIDNYGHGQSDHDMLAYALVL